MNGGSGVAFVRGASYVLGEKEADYTVIGNLNELASTYRMAPNPGLWGWGGLWLSGRDLAELAVDTGLASLRAAGTDPAQIDALVLCSNRIPGIAEGHGSFVQKVLTGIGLGDIPCYGQNLNRCANLLAGLDVARALVTCGRYRQVLLVSTDKVADDADRMSQFAIFSDGAASCIVASEPGESGEPGEAGHPGGAADAGVYELLGCATAQDTATLEWSSQISSDLARLVTDQLLADRGLMIGDLAALLHANLFKPLVVMKERQAGFSAEQLYLDNIPRIGHCFAADPLINLVDRAALGHLPEGSYSQLACSVPGSRIGALLRRVR